MRELPIPQFFSESQKRLMEVRKIDYEAIIPAGEAWAKTHNIHPAASDTKKTALMIIDGQLTFCHPQFELPVTGAMEDMSRLASFIYRNVDNISKIIPTMDTHTVQQIFHAIWLINDEGKHPTPGTIITEDDIKNGAWKVNPAVANVAGGNYTALMKHEGHYVSELAKGGRLSLMIWPYHAQLMGVGHAIVPILEEAIQFHGAAKSSQPDPEIKGGNPLTENYSVGRPEVLTTDGGQAIDSMNSKLFAALATYDRVIIAGEAKSHCVAWTIADLKKYIIDNHGDPELLKKIYLLTDCMSPVIIPNVIDFTDMANTAFDEFAQQGMRLVSSTTPMAQWPEF